MVSPGGGQRVAFRPDGAVVHDDDRPTEGIQRNNEMPPSPVRRTICSAAPIQERVATFMTRPSA